MFCSNCGAQNNEDAAYCANCGNDLRKIQTPSVDVPPLPPPQGQTSYNPQSSGPYVPTYLAPAILTTLFCCLPFGIVSIVYAAQVNGKLAAGDRPGALQSSQNAKTWAWIAFGTGLLFVLGWISLSVLGALL